MFPKKSTSKKIFDSLTNIKHDIMILGARRRFRLIKKKTKNIAGK